MKFMEIVNRIFEPLIDATIQKIITRQVAAEMQANVWWVTVGSDIVEQQIAALELTGESAEIRRHQAHAHIINYAVHRLTHDARIDHLMIMWCVSVLSHERYSATTAKFEYKAHMRWHEERLTELSFDIAALKAAFP